MNTVHFKNNNYRISASINVFQLETTVVSNFKNFLHNTTYFEIFLFKKASGLVDLNGHCIHIGENSLIFIAPYQKLNCKINISNCNGFQLVFKNEFLSNFFNDNCFVYNLHYFHNPTHPQYLQLSRKEYHSFEIILNEIITEKNNFKNDSNHIMRSLLYFYLSKINRLFSQRYKLLPVTLENSTVYNFMKMLEVYIRKHHFVEDYCQLLNISRNHLNKVLKKHFNRTAKDMILSRLLQEIKTELYYTNKTISQISDALNFSEANNLTRFFKKLEKISPKEYRRINQNDS